MRISAEIIDVLQEAIVNRLDKSTGADFQINTLDVLDLEEVTEDILVSKDFEEQTAEEIVMGLQIGRLEPLGKVMGVRFIPTPRAASLWGNT